MCLILKKEGVTFYFNILSFLCIRYTVVLIYKGKRLVTKASSVSEAKRKAATKFGISGDFEFELYHLDFKEWKQVEVDYIIEKKEKFQIVVPDVSFPSGLLYVS